MNIAAQPGVEIDGKYRLLSPLGAGAMGAVWLAEQLSVDRKVAVKLLHQNENKSRTVDARFEVEAKAIARLNHPNCITLFDFGYSEELTAFYTVIEYVKGHVLSKKMGAPMGFNDATAIIKQVAKGLDHAHFHNILHRDLKPDNLMLAAQSDGSELLKILDFGIAKIVHGEFGVDSGEQEIRLTKAGEVFGTPAYMSPEQARSTRELTPGSDFYSLGVIFYEMIDGRLPFLAATSFDVLMMHVTDEVPPFQRDDVPSEIAEVIYKLLEKHPEDRFKSGKEIIEALGSTTYEDLKPEAANTQAVPTRCFTESSEIITIAPEIAVETRTEPRNKKPYWILVILFALLTTGLVAVLAGHEPDQTASQITLTPEEPKVEKTKDIKIEDAPSAVIPLEEKEVLLEEAPVEENPEMEFAPEPAKPKKVRTKRRASKTGKPPTQVKKLKVKKYSID